MVAGHDPENSQIRLAKKVWPLQKPTSYIGHDVAFLEVTEPFNIIFGLVNFVQKLVTDKKAKFRKPIMGLMAPRKCWTFMWLDWLKGHEAQCLKFREKVSFNIASEASYVYISSKNGRFLENCSLRSNSVTR